MSQSGRGSLLTADTLQQSLRVGIIFALVSRFASFGRGLLLARALPAEELGTWALTIYAIQVGAFLCVLGIPGGLNRYAGRYQRSGRLWKEMLPQVGVALGVAVVVCVTGALAQDEISTVIYDTSAYGPLVLLALAAVLVTAGMFLVKGIMQGLRLFRLEARFELLFNVGFLLLAGALLLAWRRDAVAGAAAYLVATTIVASLMGVMLYRRLPSVRPDADGVLPDNAAQNIATPGGLKIAMVYSLGLWWAGSMEMVWQYLDRYMLLHLGNTGRQQTLADIGDYFVASKIAEPLGMLATLAGLILVPHVAHFWEEGRKAEVHSTVRLCVKMLALLLTLGGVVLVTAKDVLLRIFTGREAEAASSVMPLVTVTVIAVALCYVCRSLLLCREKTWQVATVWSGALVTNLVLNFLLIPRLHMTGAVIATLISAELTLAAILWMTARQGLRIDSGTMIACLLPLALILPTTSSLLLVGSAGICVLATNLVLTVDEKEKVLLWIAEGRNKLGWWPQTVRDISSQ